MGRYVIGVSGASGIILAYKAIAELTRIGHHVELVISNSALRTASEEMGPEYGSQKSFLASFPEPARLLITLYRINDVGASIASGSFITDGMLVIPCSMATLAAIAIGLSDNLLRRAADVTLKERRRLIILPRETPLTDIHLQHMLTLTRSGGIILPPAPAWYTKPKTLDDIENFIVGKALDLLHVNHSLYPRWNGSTL